MQLAGKPCLHFWTPEGRSFCCSWSSRTIGGWHQEDVRNWRTCVWSCHWKEWLRHLLSTLCSNYHWSFVRFALARRLLHADLKQWPILSITTLAQFGWGVKIYCSTSNLSARHSTFLIKLGVTCDTVTRAPSETTHWQHISFERGIHSDSCRPFHEGLFTSELPMEPTPSSFH